MRITCWIPNATTTHLVYEVFVAFSRQQWLRERALKLRYGAFACLV
jgi:hypothetical protein